MSEIMPTTTIGNLAMMSKGTPSKYVGITSTANSI